MEVNLPHWIDTEDITVDITEDTLGVHVHNTLSFQRSYWRPRSVPQSVCDAFSFSSQHTSLGIRSFPWFRKGIFGTGIRGRGGRG